MLTEAKIRNEFAIKHFSSNTKWMEEVLRKYDAYKELRLREESNKPPLPKK